VWHHSLLLMNSFNKNEAAIFSCRLCFLRAFPFISLILETKRGFLPLTVVCIVVRLATKCTFAGVTSKCAFVL